MQLTYRLMLLSLLIMGAAIGIAFGVGVAYGRGDPKVVDTGLTAQEIQSLVSGGGSNRAAGGLITTTGTPGAGNGGLTGLGGAGGATTGQISAINGDELTITGLQGDVKVKLSPDTAISKLDQGTAADLKVGEAITVAGDRQSDGSVNATSVTQLPASFTNRTGGSQNGGRGAPSATPTP
jgi:hypothetical protein